jgi:hypothetical protein
MKKRLIFSLQPHPDIYCFCITAPAFWRIFYRDKDGSLPETMGTGQDTLLGHRFSGGKAATKERVGSK